MQREEQAHSPTKSEWDIVVLDGLFRDEKWRNNPSGSRPNFFGRQNLTFDKGGKFSTKRGIVRFWKGLVRAKGLLSFCNGCGDGSIMIRICCICG